MSLDRCKLGHNVPHSVRFSLASPCPITPLARAAVFSFQWKIREWCY